MIETPAPSPQVAARLYDIIAVCFVTFLLISNISATKLIAFHIGSIPLVFDGGAILFPLTYVLGDVLSEVYGFAKTRRVIIIGFALSITASLVFWLVQIAPPADGYQNQAAFEAVLGFVPRIVLASLLGYIVGQLLNSKVLVVIKDRWGERHLWARLVGSTLVGELFDTAVFCTVAFLGVISGSEFLSYIVLGYVWKVGVEVVLLPWTYVVIRFVKRHEDPRVIYRSARQEVVA